MAATSAKISFVQIHFGHPAANLSANRKSFLKFPSRPPIANRVRRGWIKPADTHAGVRGLK
jgi:hypothetical protein